MLPLAGHAVGRGCGLDGLRGQDSPECGRAGLSGHHALQRRLIFGDVPCPALIGFGTRDKRCYGCYAAAGEGFGDGIFRNGCRTRLAWPADKDPPHRISCRLVGGASTPANRWLVEAPTLPPVGIAPSCVHGAFHRARKRLPALICGDKKPFATPRPRCMKSDLFGIGQIVRNQWCKISSKT
jgi:hypothetical protein